MEQCAEDGWFRLEYALDCCNMKDCFIIMIVHSSYKWHLEKKIDFWKQKENFLSKRSGSFQDIVQVSPPVLLILGTD